jgi:transcriptional regulator GlxA family with amidase domain
MKLAVIRGVALGLFCWACGLSGPYFSGFSAQLHADEPAAKAQTRKNVAVLLFDGVELLDFAGPAEVFVIAERGQAFRVFTVSAGSGDVHTMGGLTIKPDFTYANAPRADVLVVPGGDFSKLGEADLRWIRKSAGEAEITMSVCFGALLLARAGLLDDIPATTHHLAVDALRRAAPKCRVTPGKRYVDGGKIVTTAGVTAGIDGALHVLERLRGKESARWAAEEWMEHRRQTAEQ